MAAAAALLALAVDAAANSPNKLFPESDQVFHQLEADPRRIQLAASYYRLDGKDKSDIALGHSWGMLRWFTNNDYWTWQWNVEGMALSRFTIGGNLNSFETVDFVGNLPIAIRHRGFSARAMIFHESSHLGDDYIRTTGDQGFRYSQEGLRGTLSIEPLYWTRIYAGGTYLLHSLPDPAREAAQFGLELTSKPVTRSAKYPLRFFAAQDFQWKGATGWEADSRSIAGVIMGFDGVPRSMRFYVGHFEGHSPFGQLYKRRERYNDVGISFHF
jgi:hypothetical protein